MLAIRVHSERYPIFGTHFINNESELAVKLTVDYLVLVHRRQNKKRNNFYCFGHLRIKISRIKTHI